MTIQHKLEIRLTPEDIAKILADHLNKDLSSDFKIHANQIEFNLINAPDRNDIDSRTTTLKDASVVAEYIDPKSRRSH